MVTVPTIVTPYGPGYNDPDFLNLYFACSQVPNLSQQSAMMFLISSLKAAGVWTLLDGLFVFAVHDPGTALINWMQPFTTPASINNQVQFFPNIGFQADGLSGFINSNINPSIVSGNYQQNFAHIGAWSLSSVLPDFDGNLVGEANGGTAYELVPLSATNTVFSRLNETTGVSGGTPPNGSVGHFVASRNGASGSLSHYVNGVAVISGAGNATSALVNDTITFCGAGTTGNEAFLTPIATIGGYLTPTQVAALYAAEAAYLAVARTVTS